MALDELPEPVLYDLFQDAAAVLTGLYLERQRQAADPDDSAGLVAHVTRWRREATDLNTD